MNFPPLFRRFVAWFLSGLMFCTPILATGKIPASARLGANYSYRATSGTEHISAGISVGNSVQVSAGYSQSQNVASGTTHTNSTLSADTILIRAGNDATFSGANVNAKSLLDMNIDGNLELHSLKIILKMEC